MCFEKFYMNYIINFQGESKTYVRTPFYEVQRVQEVVKHCQTLQMINAVEVSIYIYWISPAEMIPKSGID